MIFTDKVKMCTDMIVSMIIGPTPTFANKQVINYSEHCAMLKNAKHIFTLRFGYLISGSVL